MNLAELRAKVAECQIEADRSQYLVQCAARDVIAANVHNGPLTVDALEGGWGRVAAAKTLYEPLAARHAVIAINLSRAKDALAVSRGPRFAVAS